MVFRADEDIPYEVMVISTGSVEAGAHAYLAKQEKLALDQLDPTAKDLAVGAGSQLITPAIQQQLPLCVHKVRCTTFVSGSVSVTVWSQHVVHLSLHSIWPADSVAESFYFDILSFLSCEAAAIARCGAAEPKQRLDCSFLLGKFGSDACIVLACMFQSSCKIQDDVCDFRTRNAHLSHLS